jgi:hypothetical protein
MLDKSNHPNIPGRAQTENLAQRAQKIRPLWSRMPIASIIAEDSHSVRSLRMPHPPTNRCRRFVTVLSLAAFWAANLQAAAIAAAHSSHHHDGSEHPAIDADACSTAHGDHAPACPCCPGCSGCCHCSLANVFCSSSPVLTIDVAPSLSQSMVDAAALYTSPSHGRLTPPPKG